MQVQLTIRTLPALPVGAKYRCVFGEAEPLDAGVTPQGLTCPTPSVKSRPLIPIGKDHILVPLSVRSSETNKDFVSRNFAFYDCSSHTRCINCVHSQWGCSWCVYENKCAHNTSLCQKIIVSGENVSTFAIYLFKIKLSTCKVQFFKSFSIEVFDRNRIEKNLYFSMYIFQYYSLVIINTLHSKYPYI